MMNNYTAWLIEPRDSLIVRDAKPFGAGITHAASLDFPFPSTTAGGVRTRSGLNGNGQFDGSKISEVIKINVKGALLASLKSSCNEIAEFYLPSPADALILQTKDQESEEKEFNLRRLLPLSKQDYESNLYPKNLSLVGVKNSDSKQKPYDKLKFWNWERVRDWLTESYDNNNQSLKEYGIENLIKDSRVHIGINQFFGSDEGNLFQTRGLEFNYGNKSLNAQKLSLVVFINESESEIVHNMSEGISPFGGERRLVSWRKLTDIDTDLLTCPSEIKEKIIETGYCRLMLLTPAYFQNGFLPLENNDFEVAAVACNRYQTVSGWDFVLGRPKPTNRLVPSGSIYFLKLNGDENQISDWVDKTWFSCVSETDSKERNFQKDGFGLSILGSWNPKE